MASGNSVMQLEQGTGWTRGLNNLLRSEFHGWFGTRMWWTQILIWAACTNLILFLTAMNSNSPPGELAMLFTIFLGLSAPVGVCIIMQEAIVGEKLSGTAAWVLSKPASRTAFIAAKLLANIAGMIATMLVVQGLIAYGIIYLYAHTALPPLGFLGGLGVHLTNLFFYLSLTLMLGALFSHRAPVIGIPLGFLFAQQFVANKMPDLAKALPWTLTFPMNGSPSPAVAVALMTGTRPATYLPVATTLGAGVLFVAVALWAFQRQEL